MDELWMPVVGFEGLYEVSDQGRVRSLDRLIWNAASARCKAHWHPFRGRVLRPGKYTKHGHLSVVLRHGAHGRPVHTLVLAAFLGPCPPGQEGLHGDGDASNNALANLRYGTRTENNIDISKHDRRKLTLDEVRQLRGLRAKGHTYEQLSKLFGICESHVGNIVHRKQYSHVA